MKATLKNYRQSPRKVRLVADLIRGKRADQAKIALTHLPKRASESLIKLLDSAVSNAQAQGTASGAEELVVKKIAVDEGFSFTRYMPRARGRATPITKRTSRVSIELAPTEKE